MPCYLTAAHTSSSLWLHQQQNSARSNAGAHPTTAQAAHTQHQAHRHGRWTQHRPRVLLMIIIMHTLSRITPTAPSLLTSTTPTGYVRGMTCKQGSKTRLSCPKGPPPDAVHMSYKLVPYITCTSRLGTRHPKTGYAWSIRAHNMPAVQLRHNAATLF